jgi:hypothetical protein
MHAGQMQADARSLSVFTNDRIRIAGMLNPARQVLLQLRVFYPNT